jgi:hypothetical protein
MWGKVRSDKQLKRTAKKERKKEKKKERRSAEENDLRF